MPATPFPHLELALFSRGARVTAGLNGAPILRNLSGEPTRTRMPLALWLAPEDNQLTVTVEPLPPEAGAPHVDVAVTPPGEDGPALCFLRWGLPAGAPFSPLRAALPFVPPALPPTRLFHEARRFPALGEAERRELQAFAVEVHRAYAGRDAGRAVALSDYRLDDTCRAFGDDLQALRAQARGEYEAWFGAPVFSLLPVRREEVRVTPCCGGRVFLLTRAGDGDLIEAVPVGRARAPSMEVFAAHIGGAWRVVR